MAQVITLNHAVIDSFDLSQLQKYTSWHTNTQYFNLSPGKEHYKLLAFFSKTMTCPTLIDVGTYLGYSAIAMSYDSSKVVYSFDVCNNIPENNFFTVKDVRSIRLSTEPYLDKLEELVKHTDFILLDIDHTGTFEKTFLDKLREINYKGILMMDDIHLNDEMKAVWNSISERKYDISKYGHWSGTGLVVFDESRFQIVLD